MKYISALTLATAALFATHGAIAAETDCRAFTSIAALNRQLPVLHLRSLDLDRKLAQLKAPDAARRTSATLHQRVLHLADLAKLLAPPYATPVNPETPFMLGKYANETRVALRVLTGMADIRQDTGVDSAVAEMNKTFAQVEGDVTTVIQNVQHLMPNEKACMAGAAS